MSIKKSENFLFFKFIYYLSENFPLIFTIHTLNDKITLLNQSEVPI